MKFLKEYRCEHCNKLFFKGELKQGNIEIKCKNCKRFTVIRGKNCRVQLFFDKKGQRDDFRAVNDFKLKKMLIECEDCSEKEECYKYKKLTEKACPICGKKLEK